MISPLDLLIIINIGVLVLGAILTVLAYRAYLRTMDSGLGALAFGIGLITIGAAVGGILHQVFDMELIAGVLVQNLSIIAGLVLFCYAVFIPNQPDSEAPSILY